MHTIGIVPDDGEVGSGGLQIGKAADGLIAEDDAVRITILGHHPDHLHLGILDVLLHHVHVRAGGGHGDVDQFGTIEFTDLEVTVVAGSGAEELNLFLLAPGSGAVEQTVGVGTGDDVTHHIQGGGTAHENLRGLAVQHIGPVGTGRGQAGQLTVVPGVDVSIEAVIGGVQHGQNVADQVQLLLCRLTAGHVQVQALCLTIFEGSQHTCVLALQFFFGHAGIGGHVHQSFRVFL